MNDIFNCKWVCTRWQYYAFTEKKNYKQKLQSNNYTNTTIQ